ncbi:MAG: signal peptidase I [Anaerolineae bacterium]
MQDDFIEPNAIEEKDPPAPRPSPGRAIVRFARELLETILPALLIALLINVFVGQATRVEGQSMEPNLHSEQRLVVEKLSYRFHGPQRFDIVVVKMPDQGEELLIKRVIGLPGETVEIRDGQVYVDGILLEEPFIDTSTHPGRDSKITVPPLHVYVMGDNRDRSNDSRSFGPVPIDNVIGRAWLSYWPPDQIGFIH